MEKNTYINSLLGSDTCSQLLTTVVITEEVKKTHTYSLTSRMNDISSSYISTKSMESSTNNQLTT